MIIKVTEAHNTIIDLRQKANFWKTQHSRAINREESWKKRALTAEKNVSTQTVQLVEKYQQIEALKVRIVWLQRQVFGRKTDQIKNYCSQFSQRRSEGSEVF